MKKQNKPIQNLDKYEVNNPYFAEIKGYLDQRDYFKSIAATWRTLCFVLAIITLIAVSGGIWIGAKSKFVPMVFYTDSSGSMQFGGIASDNLRITNSMIANQISDYLIAARQVPIDMDIKSQYLDKVKMMSNNQVYENVVLPMITDRYVQNMGQTIKVKIRNVIPISKTAYQIDWEELKDNRLIGKFKSTISFTMNLDFSDPAVALNDPLGIVINDININQEVQ